MLTCSKCGEEKIESDFAARSDRPRGFTSKCKVCLKAVNKAAYTKSAETNRARAAAYRELNPPTGSAYQAAYREAHREKSREYFRQYAKDNPHKKRATSVSRRAKKLNATPSWSDPKQVEEVYRRAKKVESACGTTMHVDHIVPLVHPLVCGLHCEANLRVIPATKNLSKGNNYWPNMP